MKKAYSYIRMSSEKQLKGDSLRRQLQLSKDYAIKNKLHLVETTQDLGVSAYKGANAKKGGFSKILAAIECGEIKAGDYLLVESLDRISRQNVMTAFRQFSDILEYGVVIVTLADEQKYSQQSVSNDVGQLFTSIGIMLRANEESRIKSQRLKQAWANKRSMISDKKITSRVVPWVRLNNDKQGFSIIQDRVNIVNEIFSLSLNGMGNFAIARYLNEKNIPSFTGKTFHKSYIQKLLTNRAVLGEFQPKVLIDGKRIAEGDPILDYYPQIITSDTFEKAQVAREKRKVSGSGRKNSSFNNLFSGILICESCGSKISYLDKGKKPKGHPTMQCSNSIRKAGCKSFAWNYEEFEKAFFQYIQEVNLLDVVTENESLSKLQVLRDKRDMLLAGIRKHQKIKKRFNEILHSDDMGTTSIKDAASHIDQCNKHIDSNKKEIKALDLTIAEIEGQDIQRDLNDIKNIINQINNEENLMKKYVMRSKASSLIKQTVSVIKLDSDHHIDPALDYLGTTHNIDGEQTASIIPDKLRQALSKKGITTESDLEAYFSTPYGKRVYNNSSKSLTVIYKTGKTKKIIPYLHLQFAFINPSIKHSLTKIA